MKIFSLKSGLAATVLVALLAAGCGDDSDDSADDPADSTETTDPADGATTGAGDDDPEQADLAAYCDAVVGIETAPAPDIDFETATEEEIAAGMQTYAAEVIRPLADEVIAVAPEELADDAATMDGAVDEMASTGDFGVFEQPDVAAAEDRLHAFDLANCGWESLDVSAHDYGFDGLGDELAAGLTSFEFSNEGDEVHELLLVRKNDGVTESADELLALPEEEAMQKVTMLGEPAFADPGGDDYKVVDLEPGDYVAVCFIPVGTTDTEGGPPADGPPHFTQGMVAEFTVS
jgi:hypothetical protein